MSLDCMAISTDSGIMRSSSLWLGDGSELRPAKAKAGTDVSSPCCNGRLGLCLLALLVPPSGDLRPYRLQLEGVIAARLDRRNVHGLSGHDIPRGAEELEHELQRGIRQLGPRIGDEFLIAAARGCRCRRSGRPPMADERCRIRQRAI